MNEVLQQCSIFMKAKKDQKNSLNIREVNTYARDKQTLVRMYSIVSRMCAYACARASAKTELQIINM